MMNAKIPEEIRNALKIAVDCGNTDGEHHKEWVIDQMVRALCGCPVNEFGSFEENARYNGLIKNITTGDEGPNTYEWSIGIPP